MNVPRVQTVVEHAVAPASAQRLGEWLQPLPGHWIEAACEQLAQHRAIARVLVVALRGSAPREAGACMLVTMRGTLGTIGGGRLEWQAIAAARELLSRPRPRAVRIEDLVLGPQLGQCCGGRVELWLERLTRADLPWLRTADRALRKREAVDVETRVDGQFTTHCVTTVGASAMALTTVATSAQLNSGVRLSRIAPQQFTLLERCATQRPPLWIYGAGHIGQALVRLLAESALFDITWLDSRAALLPPGLPACVTTLAPATPVTTVNQAPAACSFVVLTHDHTLDYELCHAILRRESQDWLGLIGSASKAARFRSRLMRAGITQTSLARMRCPIGVPGINSKVPLAIAIAIAAQLLQRQGPAAAQVVEPCTATCGDCVQAARSEV